MSNVFNVKIYKMPGEKPHRRELSKEEREFSENLGKLINTHGLNAWRYLSGETITSNKAPGYISDIMEPTVHMVNMKTYDSKSEFRKATKEAGCIEIGNEVQTMLKPRKPREMDKGRRREDIKRALYEVRNGRRG